MFNISGKKICVFSFDDNKTYDYKMTEIFDKYGAKCTYNVNSYCIEKEGYVDRGFIKELSTRHEIACHTVTHPKGLHLDNLDVIKREIIDDKKALEDIIGKEICGMAYPYGEYNDRIIEMLKLAGIKYARTVKDTFSFGSPIDPYEWHPSCHQSKALPVIEEFKNKDQGVLFIWGHSIEFKDNWNKLIDILERIKDVENLEFMTSEQVYRLI